MKDAFDPTNVDGSGYHEKIIYSVPAESVGDEVIFDSWCETCRIYVARCSHLCSVCLFPPRTAVQEAPPSPHEGTGVDQVSRQGDADALTQDDTLTSRLRRRAARTPAVSAKRAASIVDTSGALAQTLATLPAGQRRSHTETAVLGVARSGQEGK